MATISICSKILSTIASPAFAKAYEKGVSLWQAKNELNKLKETIETIQIVLNDAEKKQEGSDSIKNWIRRLKGVLFDAEDFFDEVLTEDLLKQQMMEGKNKLSLKNKVRVSCSKLNPVVSRNSIAKKVGAIRERLAEISSDMAQLGFVQSHPNNPTAGIERMKNPEICFIDEKYVIGRDEDKKAILEMLNGESLDTAIPDSLVVIAIDGIGGMGKTTLAHLIYNDESIEKNFDKRWFACISNTSSEIEVLEKIYQPMCESGTHNGLSEIQLVDKIRNSVKGKKYLLVLDDVWESHHGRWENRKSVLSSGAKGSKIIVTTRLQSVVMAMSAIRAHNLGGLSEGDSWNLFKTLAFDSSYKNDPIREVVGRELLKRCRGVPLAIWCMGSLLHNKTIQEWEEIERVGLPTVGGDYNDEVMRILKLSYDHLPSYLKQCFTYCCLFPKDYRYGKKELIYHWIAQGYINLDEGESSFMHLLRMGVFQEAWSDGFGDILSCKMHDIMHDLALHLDGEESIMQKGASLNVNNCTRYVSLMVDGEEGGIWDIPKSLIDSKSIRSCMLSRLSSRHSQPNLNQLCSNFKLLRTLKLSGMGIEHIPDSIGELKLVRYLDLSLNEFEGLPESIANLVNLLVLDISHCGRLKAWPHNFRKLIKLWSLNLWDCYKLSLMPEGIGGMSCLQYLSNFEVVKESELDVLTTLLKQLRGYLSIRFRKEMAVEDEWRWQLPADTSLQRLNILYYPGQRILGWGNNKSTSKLQHLELSYCEHVKYLPLLSSFPFLKHLALENLKELEFIEEEEEEVNTRNNARSRDKFFPCLEDLRLDELPELKGWRRKVAAEAMPSSSKSTVSAFPEFPHLSNLVIMDCPKLGLESSFPLCPHLQEPSYACPSLRKLRIWRCYSLISLHLASPHLLEIEIRMCNKLESIELVGIPEPSLRCIEICDCRQLKSLQADEHLFAGVEKMEITDSPDLRLCKPQDERLLVQQALPRVEKQELVLKNVTGEFAERLAFAMSSLKKILISKCNGPISLRVTSTKLKKLNVFQCEGLNSVEVEAPNHIRIYRCPELKNLRIANPNYIKSFEISSAPSTSVVWDTIPNLSDCSRINTIRLVGVDSVFIQRLLPSSSTSAPGFVTVPVKYLVTIMIRHVHDLEVLDLKSECLEYIEISDCSQLKNVRMDHPGSVKNFRVFDCPEWGLITGGVDWDSLTNGCYLRLGQVSRLEDPPQSLLRRDELGELKINGAWYPDSSSGSDTNYCMYSSPDDSE